MKTEIPFSFGCIDSKVDYRTVVSTMVGPINPNLPVANKIDFSQSPLGVNYDQFVIGECTMCATSKAGECALHITKSVAHLWGFLMGKVLVDGNLTEGSSALTMLKTGNKFGLPTDEVCSKYPLNNKNSYADLIYQFQTTYLGKIPQEILDDAAKNKLPGYYQVPVDPVSLANEIDKGNPIIARLAVGNNTYTDVNGNVNWSALALLPLRAPNPATGGHLLCLNEYQGLDLNQLLQGPNSWGTRWCPENNGYINFIFSTQKPYFTEAWAISPLPPVIQHQVNVLPPPPQTWWEKFKALMFNSGFRIINNAWVYKGKPF